MGRNATSVTLQVAQGNPNRLTKKEIAERMASEVKLGKTDLDKLKPPVFIKQNAIALAQWKLHIKEYKSAADQGVELLTSSDVNSLALYCKTFAEYAGLLSMYETLENKYGADLTVVLDDLLKLETAINKKVDMLLKMQDRLFLNPLAKVKNVPKPKGKEKPQSKFAKFGGARLG